MQTLTIFVLIGFGCACVVIDTSASKPTFGTPCQAIYDDTVCLLYCDLTDHMCHYIPLTMCDPVARECRRIGHGLVCTHKNGVYVDVPCPDWANPRYSSMESTRSKHTIRMVLGFSANMCCVLVLIVGMLRGRRGRSYSVDRRLMRAHVICELREYSMPKEHSW